MAPTFRPIVLMILDGFGWREETSYNATKLAKMPNLTRILETSPHSLLHASGTAVGLPEGQMGNSEVGHLTLGAGRKILQTLPRITEAVKARDVHALPGLGKFISALKETGGTCHLFGLASPGGVHAHQEHIEALAEMVAKEGVKVDLHLFTDGRDTPPKSAAEYVANITAKLPANVSVATVSGRYYAMDRDNRWDRVQKAYDAIAFGKGPHFKTSGDVIEASYKEDVTDEFIIPAVIGDYKGMRDDDGILSANFRADRIQQLLEAFVMPDFDEFDRGTPFKLVHTCAMTRYSDRLSPYLNVLFPKEEIKDILGELVADKGLTQLRIAETEKYPHVTYFFNGGEERQYPGEDRILVPSPKVATYDLMPAMSAQAITRKTVEAIKSKKYDLIVLNFANPDMVGHTGCLAAAAEACDAVDVGIGEIDAALKEVGGAALITADHGNCEVMKDPVTGKPHTAHTLNDVPFIFVNAPKGEKLENGTLADVTPTILHLLGLPKPASMNGKNLAIS